jgi:hypothetical protein
VIRKRRKCHLRSDGAKPEHSHEALRVARGDPVLALSASEEQQPFDLVLGGGLYLWEL